uniref:Uncharacterized protein n=1 Tax=Vitis vinifera TaxID=29760 RepID=F6HSJ6_VITVI
MGLWDSIFDWLRRMTI